MSHLLKTYKNIKLLSFFNDISRAGEVLTNQHNKVNKPNKMIIARFNLALNPFLHSKLLIFLNMTEINPDKENL